MGGSGSVPTEPSPQDPAGRPPSLRWLLLEVQRTRAEHSAEQGERGATAQTLLPVRRAALKALEDYSSALHRQGWPTPGQMKLDIQLLRALCGVQRSHPPAWN
jgi:hypothetical protein